jgi:hypothetical protein
MVPNEGEIQKRQYLNAPQGFEVKQAHDGPFRCLVEASGDSGQRQPVLQA